jgi:hypothetical protein
MKDDKRLHLHGQAFQEELFDPEDADTTFCQNAMNCLPKDMLSCCRRLAPSAAPQISQRLKQLREMTVMQDTPSYNSIFLAKAGNSAF